MHSGEETAKANRKAVLSQLMAPSETLKYSEDVVETGANVSHCQKVNKVQDKDRVLTIRSLIAQKKN